MRALLLTVTQALMNDDRNFVVMAMVTVMTTMMVLRLSKRVDRDKQKQNGQEILLHIFTPYGDTHPCRQRVSAFDCTPRRFICSTRNDDLSHVEQIRT